MSNYLVYRESHTEKVVVDAIVAANAVTKHITGTVGFVYRGTKYHVNDALDVTVTLAALPGGFGITATPLPASISAGLGLP